eukprot:Plantae.Rhodophyta-Purpureofilum_apyrenoidigerum.ctg1906.p1 GENE.Plantae.Rhodophyta-Purpureofilum_apyrenoidigerum.ctg1906~~Plantae.Rhodophyta-Purpureofilum_apyrenoidigerum.ctg1906.p1  ORF type:complete len:250 (-),score=34.81 Plantae.Rhodophyta-Purpureofilum_apyrenoidigerum.ctg1906:288-1037(-)
MTNRDTQGRNRKCDKCDMMFEYPYILKLHSRKHGDEKPHRCNQANCGKSFKWRTSLLAHEKSHSSGRLRTSKSQDKATVRNTGKGGRKAKSDKPQEELAEPKFVPGSQTGGAGDATSIMSLLPFQTDEGCSGSNAFEALEDTQPEGSHMGFIGPASDTTPVLSRNLDAEFEAEQTFGGPSATPTRDGVDDFVPVGHLWEPSFERERLPDTQANTYWGTDMGFGLPGDSGLCRLNPTDDILDGEAMSPYT